MSYRVEVVRRAQKRLSRIQAQDRIMEAIDALADDPKPHGSKKLQGTAGSWRIRVGDYRVIYLMDEQAREITVTKVAHRREVYRG